MTPSSWRYIIVLGLALAHVVHAEPYRLSFVKGEAVTTFEQSEMSSTDHQGTLTPAPMKDLNGVQNKEEVKVDPQKLGTIVQDILQNKTSSLSLRLWLSSANTIQDLDMMIDTRSRELESLTEEVRTYLLNYTGQFSFYAVDDSGLLVHVKSSTTPGVSSCLRWMWVRRWEQAYVFAHVKIEDMPEFIMQWIRENPYQTTFYIVDGVAFFVPGALYGPVIHWLGWSELGVRAGRFAAALQSTLNGGAVSAGGWFATLTSAGMFGYGVSALNGIVAGAVVLVGVGSLGYEFWGCYSNSTMPPW